MERATTTASSLEAEQDSGNINSTQSMTTLNESFPQGTNLGSGPKRQDTILGGAKAQIRLEAASKQSNDSPLLRVNTLVTDETIIKEWEDIMERVVTTAFSLEAEQVSDNINRTQSMATLNESFPQGTNSGSSPRCEDTILGVQKLKFDLRLHLNKSYDPPLSRVNILGSGEDIMKLKELMGFCTKLSVMDLNV
ncbi:hypothetical protein Tco_0812152 [Tanacetum coccineum]